MPRNPKQLVRKKSPKLKIESYETLIDKAFSEKIDITENGKKSRVTVFSAIYKKLLHQAITMKDGSALRARLAYDKFAQGKEPEEPEKIVIVHRGQKYRR